MVYSSVFTRILRVHMHLLAMLGFEASTDPVDTLAQAALATHQTMEQEESSVTTFMVM
jgi:hypothetical protein